MTETVEKQPAANAPGEMAQAGDDPTARFRAWLGEATAAGSREPTAMSLATTDAIGRPDVRMVLLKDADERGFVFYTNLSSPKAKALRQDSRVALCFYWDVIDKQVRVRGRAQPVDDEQADSYFATRPRLSQIGAWASHQSQPMRGYFELEAQVAKMAVRFGLGEVPLLAGRIEHRLVVEHSVRDRRAVADHDDVLEPGAMPEALQRRQQRFVHQ